MGRRLSKNKVKSFSLRRFRDYINARVAFINADKVFVSVGVGFINVLCYINARVAFINAGKVFVSVGVGFINVVCYINARVAFINVGKVTISSTTRL